MLLVTIVLALSCVSATLAKSCQDVTDVLAKTEYGWVRGVRSPDEYGNAYASFKGVPYAKQPLGELRFKELQIPDSWDDIYNATTEGPICPQRDVFYGPLMQPSGMSEACIHANVYVPMDALPSADCGNETLPVLVYIHGGGFAFGSSDADVNGPQYLMSENIILVTFNYRIGPFGFLSLNSTRIPGNNGLRDMLTLLRWVQRNIKAFGGIPADVTIAGQSAGASAAHLLTLSKESKDLFHRAILMSGTGTRQFFTTSPAYSAEIAQQFLTGLGINTTDPDEIHAQLIETPMEDIMNVSIELLDNSGLVTFVPVVESTLENVTAIIDDDPETLELMGRSQNISLIIGSTNVECETYRPRFEQIDIVSIIQKNPTTMLPISLTYRLSEAQQNETALKVMSRYFKGNGTIQEFLDYCSFSYLQYPAFKLAQWRSKMEGAPVFLYNFGYDPKDSVMERALNLSYIGSGHLEDLTFVLRPNSFVTPGLNDSRIGSTDELMVTWMSRFFANYVKVGSPTGVDSENSEWPPVNDNELKYQDISVPNVYNDQSLTEEFKTNFEFFDSLYSQ